MDRMLYIATSGARHAMAAQSVTASNLANVNTPGFRSDFAQMRSMPVFGEGYPSRVYALSESPASNVNEEGPLQTTGRDLDVAIAGPGWLAVASPEGEEAYTRSGELVVDPTGRLLTPEGLEVMGDGGPIVIPPYDKLDIGGDGTINIVPLGQTAQNQAVVGRLKLVNPPTEDLYKGLDGLMHLPAGVEAEVDANVRVIPGALEMSNVNAVGSMVEMLQYARHFELQIKMMKTAEETDQQSSKLLSAG
jgi:flagellar basal-body rod protein FlgF